MGCSGSKFDYKVEVLQSKVSKGYLKKTLLSCKAFSDAHFAYSISLQNLGILLSDYGQSENASNLSQLFDQLGYHFLQAFESVGHVSKLLDPIHMHHNSNSADINVKFDYPARATPAITLNLSCKCLKHKNERDNDLDFDLDIDESKMYVAILNKMLAWEMKLYEEVKASELMKIEHQKKTALLNKQKSSVTNEKTLEKTEAGVRFSCARYIVDMNSLDFTFSEINHLKEKQLYPKLLELVDAMAKMWQTMYTHQGSQLKIADTLKKLDVLVSAKDTSYQHLERTQRLVNVLYEWHIQLINLIKYQKQHIGAMNEWINLIPKESNSTENASSKVQMLVQEWHELLEKVSDKQVLGTIHSLIEVVKCVLVLQEDEMRMKEKCEDTKREYKRKNHELLDAWYEHLKGNNANERVEPDEVIEKRKEEVENLKTKLKEEEDLYQVVCKHAREKSVQSLKKHFPELFEALCEFANNFLEMYQRLRSIGDDESEGK